MNPKFKICKVDSKGIDRERGIIPFVLTERMVDRDSEVIEPNGGDLENFKKNPVFLWAHDLSLPSIGRVIPESINISKQRIKADVQFDMEDPFAKMIFNKYDKGFLSAGSIRFIPFTFGKKPVLPEQRGMTIEKWELLEFSAVPVPANAGALAQKEFGETENGKRWYEVLKSFMEDDTFDHSPEGWIEKMNKENEEAVAEGDQEDNGKALDLENVVSVAGVKVGDFTIDVAGGIAFNTSNDSSPDGFKIMPFPESGNYYFVFTGDETEEKAGRVLSKKNRGLVQAAKDALDKLLAADSKPEDNEEEGGKAVKLAPVDEEFKEHAYSQEHFALIKDAGDDVDACIFPHHNEKNEVVWKAVVSSMIALLENQTGLNNDDIKNAYEHLAEHYAQFGKKAPELILVDDSDVDELNDELVNEISPEIINAVLDEIEKEK